MDRVEYSATIRQLFIHHLTTERPQSRGDVSLYGMVPLEMRKEMWVGAVGEFYLPVWDVAE